MSMSELAATATGQPCASQDLDREMDNKCRDEALVASENAGAVRVVRLVASAAGRRRGVSSRTLTWSTRSRRMPPTQRSANGLCQGG